MEAAEGKTGMVDTSIKKEKIKYGKQESGDLPTIAV